MYVCHFSHGGDTFPLGTTSLLERSSGLQEAYTKLAPIRPKKLPQHVGAMSWHAAKFRDFQACFGFTSIKKPSFTIFPAEPRRPDVWISFPFLAWDLEIHPRTHMWFWEGTCHLCVWNDIHLRNDIHCPLLIFLQRKHRTIWVSC